MTTVADIVLDGSIDVIRTATENIYICSQEPTTFTEASSTYKLGTKASPTISTATDGDTSGRKITVSAITDGVVNSAGTASHIAFTDDSASTLLYAFALDSTLPLATGSPWTTAAFDIEIPDPA